MDAEVIRSLDRLYGGARGGRGALRRAIPSSPSFSATSSASSDDTFKVRACGAGTSPERKRRRRHNLDPPLCSERETKLNAKRNPLVGRRKNEGSREQDTNEEMTKDESFERVDPSRRLYAPLPSMIYQTPLASLLEESSTSQSRPVMSAVSLIHEGFLREVLRCGALHETSSAFRNARRVLPRLTDSVGILDSSCEARVQSVFGGSSDQILTNKLNKKFLVLHGKGQKKVSASSSDGSQSRRSRGEKRLERLRQRRKLLTSRERKSMHLFRIPDEAKKYVLYEALHTMWCQYFQTIAGPELNNSTVENRLLKADFHGAKLCVVKSTIPHFVGVEGIVLQETEKTFRMISEQDRFYVVPKAQCVFGLEFEGRAWVLHGEHFEFRSYDRAVRKFKNRETFRL